MGNFIQIKEKLNQFIKKYYTNELIKGVFLFFTIGLLYFFITLLIEYFLWLKPVLRTILFILFLLVEIALLVFYIVIPIFKIFGLKKGINDLQASEIIGKHFPEVSDKLLNMIQLKQSSQKSELIEASIEQKSAALRFIPFKRAIDFKANKKYLKYALIPILIWLLIFITGNLNVFNDSFSRVVQYNKQFEPPAPFYFNLLNNSLNVVEGQPLTLQIETKGDVMPEDAKIYFSNENYYLKNNGLGNFEYTFASVNSNIDFYIEANGVQSKYYTINVLATPIITNLSLQLKYPSYTQKANETINNSGNAMVPEGTTISWKVATHQTEAVTFFSNDSVKLFSKPTAESFEYSQPFYKSTNYKIATSNEQIKNYESLNFAIEVVKDEFPKIIVESDIDSISRGPVQFVGQLSDDYAVKKLEFVYYNKSNPTTQKRLKIDVMKQSLTNFYYVFPEGIEIEKGVDYEFHFEVFDNDAVNGSKKTKSKKFSFYNKTEKELKAELLEEQASSLNAMKEAVEQSKKENKALEDFKEELQKKAEINWNDTKKLEDFLKRQNEYQELFEKQTKDLEKNLKEQPTSNNLKDKKQALENRMEEIQKMAEQEKMLEELNKLTEKIEKEDLVEKLKEIAKKNQQKEQSLERILELTKRFYVEQKANQISEKLEELAEEQEALSNQNEEENTAEKQEEINKEFEEIKEDFEQLKKQNEELKRPMDIPDNQNEQEEIQEDLDKASDDLKKEQKKAAKKSQKSAAKKMKEMSKSMEKTMMNMSGEMIQENIDDLRKIVENLIEFSFMQEDLLERFSSSSNNNPEFPKNLRKQNTLKTYFEHIDDSIYMLSLRLVTMGASIQKEVSDANDNIDASLANFSDNKIDQGTTNQRFVITAVNNLANQLSDILESLMNASVGMGKQQGKDNQSGFALPDIIKKQGELSEKMKEGQQKGQQSGGEKGNQKGKENPSNSGEEMNGELFEIYKQQAELRKMLEDLMGEQEGGKGSGGKEAIKQMEELEKEMLEKGFSNEVIQKMQALNYELLKLEKAKKEQGTDEQRQSETNTQNFENITKDSLKLKSEYFNYNEILNRQSLPLRSIYKKKVQEYFNQEN